MSHNWEIGPRNKCWLSVQAAFNNVDGNHTANSSDKGVHHTGYMALKTSKKATGDADSDGYLVGR